MHACIIMFTSDSNDCISAALGTGSQPTGKSDDKEGELQEHQMRREFREKKREDGFRGIQLQTHARLYAFRMFACLSDISHTGSWMHNNLAPCPVNLPAAE